MDAERCSVHTIHLESLHEAELEMERLRGEMKALASRVQVYEGFINSTSTRFHVSLDEIEKTIKEVDDRQNGNHSAQQKDVETLKLHFKYIAGIAAGIGLLLTYFDKIIKLFRP